MRYIEGDILDITYGIIVHQVNCQKVMGAGIAKQIANKYPVVKVQYLDYCDSFIDEYDMIGTVNFAKVYCEKNLYIANTFSQFAYGRKSNICYTDYEAFMKCMDKIKHFSSERYLPVYIPYKIGCGLAGGDWSVVKDILEEYPFTVVKRREDN